jgi:hypothetical protein
MAPMALKLAAAHFIAWICIQRHSWLPEQACANNRFWRAAGGAAAYAVISFVFLAVGRQPSFDLLTAVWLALATAAVRLIVDALCMWFAPRCWWSLLCVQVIQLWAICGTAALALYPIGLDEPLYEFSSLMRDIIGRPQTYGLLATYIVSLALGGALVRLVTSLLPARSGEERIGMEGAGSIIGILERLLVTSFVLFWPAFGAAAVGLIFSAKSIARFPEMGKKDGTHFAEYYLVGTLTSFTVAIGAGMIARSYLLG